MLAVAGVAVLLSATSSWGHVTFQPDTIPFDGSYYRSALRLGHGCIVESQNGSSTDEYLPVSKLTTNVPKSLLSEGDVRAEWISGWPATFKEENNGSMTVTWTGDKPLPTNQFMEFGLTMVLPVHDGSIDGFEFPTSQICDSGGDDARMDWLGEDVPTLTYADPCVCKSQADAHAHHGGMGAMPGMAPAEAEAQSTREAETAAAPPTAAADAAATVCGAAHVAVIAGTAAGALAALTF